MQFVEIIIKQSLVKSHTDKIIIKKNNVLMYVFELRVLASKANQVLLLPYKTVTENSNMLLCVSNKGGHLSAARTTQ